MDSGSTETMVSNGNDWNQQGGNDWQQQPSGQPSNPNPDPGGSYGPPPKQNGPSTDMITEGWGGGEEVTFDEVLDRLKLVAKRAQGPVLTAWLMAGAVLLAFDLLGGLLHVVNYFIDSVAVSGALGIVEMVLGFVASVAGFLVVSLQLGLMKPLYRQVFGGQSSVTTPKEALNESKGVFGPMLIVSLIIGLAMGIGGMCCLVPGIFLAFVFCQAPYLVATKGLSPLDAIQTSLQINKQYWQVILVAVVGMAIAGVIGGVVMVIGGGIVGALSSLIAPFNVPLLEIAYWVGGQVIAFGVMLVHMAIFSTIETKKTQKFPA